MDLFDTKPLREPLASRMRPRNLDEYVGQAHIIGKGRLLRRAIQADQLTSVIFYGPPGTGKTTLARVIANHTKSNFVTLNAVLTGVADIREAIKNADDWKKHYDKRTILFVDEVHRWNKSQQDALLPWVENGTFILIGATTENPFFEVNRALVSRSRVFQLKPLSDDDLMKAARQAISDSARGYGRWRVEFEDGALEHLVRTANGDARSLLNALELAVETTPEKWPPADGSMIYISKETAEESIQKKVVLYDKDGDYHYDIISAFIKSLRGRDPDAAMYWLARMVRAGEDASFIFRRMLISACEDTGLADPNAITVVQSCASAFDRVGMPEGRYFLAHAALYLATAPKSNSSMAFFDALSSVEKEDADVPNHLRDSSRDAEQFGHGDGYLYPHAYRDHWVAQQYLPSALVSRVFYTPTEQGYEAKIREDVLRRREIQISAILEKTVRKPDSGASCGMHPLPKFAADFGNPFGEWWTGSVFGINSVQKEENLTYSPEDEKKEDALSRADKSWRSRIESNRAEVLSQLRDAMISIAELKRHSRSLVMGADDGLLIWEVARKTPEGITCGTCRSDDGMKILEQYSRTLDDLDRPVLVLGTDLPSALLHFRGKEIEFDRIFVREPFRTVDSISDFAGSLQVASDGYGFQGRIVVSQRVPKNGQRLSALVSKIAPPSSDILSLSESMRKAEDELFADSALGGMFSWDGSDVSRVLKERGFSVVLASKQIEEKRRVSDGEIDAWFDSARSQYGKAVVPALGGGAEMVRNHLKSFCRSSLVSWQSEILFLSIDVVR